MMGRQPMVGDSEHDYWWLDESARVKDLLEIMIKY